MAQISMKSTKKDRSDNVACCGQVDQPEYPWGLTINLENESIEKLGVNFKRFPVGRKVKLVCEAEVVSASMESMKDGKDSKSIRLQIVSMAKPVVRDRMKAGTDLLDDMRRK